MGSTAAAPARPAPPYNPPQPRQRRAPGIIRKFFGSFWIRRIWLSRIIPILLFGYLTYNHFNFWGWHFSYWHWLVGYGSSLSSMSGQEVLISLLVMVVTVLIVGGLWGYILTKAWQGVGAKILKAAIIPVILTIVFVIMFMTNTLQWGSTLSIFLIETAILVVIGWDFSFTLIDRHLSGTITAATTIQRNETYEVPPQDHDPHYDHEHHDNVR